jgi:hypothetical protein
MKTITITIYLIFCAVYVSNGQANIFNRVYDDFHLADLRNIIEYNEGYVALGGGRLLENPTGKVKIILLHVDYQGNTVWTKSYGNEIYDYYHGTRNSLIENSDGGYSLAGSQNNDTINACMLMKFDQNFDTVWTKLYFDNADFTVLYNHIQTIDGGYALVGTHDEDDPDGDVLLIKTDSEGNMQWYKKYGTSARDMGLCVIETDDGGYLIGGASSGLGNGNGYLLKTDVNGNLQWTKNYGNPLYPDGSIYNIVKTPDNEYIIPLTSYVTDPISASFYNRKYNIIKLDSDFNEIWSKQYGIRAEYTSLATVTVTSDGSIWATVKDDMNVGLFHISSDGDSISKNYFAAEGSIGDRSLLSIKQAPDNGFIMAGVAFDPQVMWLVKTDSCGCIVEDCECGGSAVQQHIANNEIEVYPNPAKDVLQFNLPQNAKNLRVEIYDNLGRLMITNELLGWKSSINISQLKSGNYFVRMITDNENWRGWFVKE